MWPFAVFRPNVLASAISVLASASLAVPSQPAHAQAPAWAPKPYKPKSPRDFTGIWRNTGGIGWTPGIPPGPRQNPPLTPEYRKIFDQRVKDAAEGKPSGDLTANCLPQGMPRIMTMTYPMEIIQNDAQVNIYAEWQEQTRRVFIDGRPHPGPDDLEATYYGDSIGHWDGPNLMVDTIGLRSDTDLEASGLPHSDALRVQEKIWLADDNTLKDEITLIDPKAYTHPWTDQNLCPRRAGLHPDALRVRREQPQPDRRQRPHHLGVEKGGLGLSPLQQLCEIGADRDGRECLVSAFCLGCDLAHEWSRP